MELLSWLLVIAVSAIFGFIGGLYGTTYQSRCHREADMESLESLRLAMQARASGRSGSSQLA